MINIKNIDKTIQFPTPPANKQGWPWIIPLEPPIRDQTIASYPKISIITPSYNQGKFIEETVRSVLLQGYPNLEYIIIDGGSTDETLSIIKKYEPWITYWVSEKDKGQSDALNKGLAKVTGDIVGWLNSDDVYEPGIFYELVKLFADTQINIVNGDCYVINEVSEKTYLVHADPVTLDRLLNYWIPKSMPPQPSVFFRNHVLKEAGMIDSGLHYAMDYDLWLRMISHYSFTYIPKALSCYRFHSDSKSVMDGGYEKFFPEWHLIFKRFMKSQNIWLRTKYLTNYHHYQAKGTKPKSMLMITQLLKELLRKNEDG